MNKLLVVVVSDDEAKAGVALRMASRMRERGNLQDVKVMFFGPSEKLLASPPQALAQPLRVVAAAEAPMACSGVASELGVLESLEASGTKLVAAGQEIERLVLDGYEVITF